MITSSWTRDQVKLDLGSQLAGPKITSSWIRDQVKLNQRSHQAEPEIRWSWTRDHCKLNQRSHQAESAIRSNWTRDQVRLKRRFGQIKPEIGPKWTRDRVKMNQRSGQIASEIRSNGIKDQVKLNQTSGQADQRSGQYEKENRLFIKVENILNGQLQRAELLVGSRLHEHENIVNMKMIYCIIAGSLNRINRNTMSGRTGLAYPWTCVRAPVAAASLAICWPRLHRAILGGWGCDQSIGYTVSDAFVSCWLWSTATRLPTWVSWVNYCK